MRNRTRRRLALLGILALALSVTAGLTASDLAAAKKKKKAKAGGTVDITKPVAAAVPDATVGPPATVGTLASTIDVAGKKFKGTKIRDVNVTVQTTGAGPPDMMGAGGSIRDLSILVTAPNGATTWLFGTGGLNGQSFGPLTFDDESVNALSGGPPPAANPTELRAPYVGTAQPYCYYAFGSCPLSLMDGGGVTGTWTLRVQDSGTGAGNTSILNQWRIVVQAGKAFQTK